MRWGRAGRGGEAEPASSPTRERLLELIRQDPGASLQDLATAVGLNRTSTIRHLRLLEGEGRIQSVRQGRRLLHFPAGVQDGLHRTVLGALRLETARLVLEALHEDPGMSWRRLAKRLDVTPKAVRWHVQRLREQGILEVIDAGSGPRHAVVLHERLRETLTVSPSPLD